MERVLHARLTATAGLIYEAREREMVFLETQEDDSRAVDGSQPDKDSFHPLLQSFTYGVITVTKSERQGSIDEVPTWGI